MAYYEQQLNKEQRAAYAAMLKGFAAVESEVRVPLLGMKELSELYTRLRLDHPELFYLTGFHVRAVPGAEWGELVPGYLFDKGKILQHRSAINARIARLTRDAKTLSESEKILFLHRFITENVRYDKLEKPYSHEIIGPLTQGVGVCEGIAKTVKILADSMGLNCLVVLSAPEEGKKYGHAWNVIRRGKAWYHMDVTFDLSLGRCGETRYDYCMLGDTAIYRDHVKPVYAVPECADGSGFYYKEQRLSLTKTEDAAKRTAQAAKKKRPRFIFHWRGGYLTRDAMKEITQEVIAAVQEQGKGAEISLNWPQAVFCVRFLDAPGRQNEPELETAEE